MGQDIKQILDLLNEMKRANDANIQSFDRLLKRINSKLKLTDNKSDKELANTFIDEIKKSVNSKYTSTVKKIENIENALKNAEDSENGEFLNSDIRELVGAFAGSVNDFYSEAKLDKQTLLSIDDRLSKFIDDKSDKNEILSAVSNIKQDFESINSSYKNGMDEINSSLKAVISEMDKLKSGENEDLKKQVQIIHESVSGIVSELKEQEEKYKNFERILDKVSANDELKNAKETLDTLISKTEAIEDKINNMSSLREDKSEDIGAAIREKLEFLLTKDEFSSALNAKSDEAASITTELKQTLAKVAEDVEKVSDASFLQNSLGEIYSKIENISADIENSDIKGGISDLNLKLEHLKDELSVVKDIVSDLNEALTDKILNAVKSSFDEASADLIKSVVSTSLENISTKEDVDKIRETSNNILEKSDNIASGLTSLSEFVHGNLPVNLDYIKEQINLIKAAVISSKTAAQKVIPSEINDDSLTVQYIDEVKGLAGGNGNLSDKLTDIKDLLVNHNTHNETEFSKLIQKLENFESIISSGLSDAEANANTVSELSELKSSIAELCKSVDDLPKNEINPEYFDNFTAFLETKFKELYQDMEELTSSARDDIKRGFAYNTELLEEKTDVILNLIGEIKKNETVNSDLEGKIEQIYGKLSDFKEELSLINTDIVENFTAKTENVISEFESLKDMLANLHFEDYVNDVKSKIDEIHDLTKQNFDLDGALEALYKKVSGNISETEGKLKDFVLSDTDSLIIKMDNLREYMETALKSLVPPEPKKMRELFEFTSNINKFKKEQTDLFKNLTSEISKKHGELKSMISVAMNHDDIIMAIENLKNTLGKKIHKLGRGITPVEGAPETEIDESEYTEVLEDLRQDYRHFSGIIQNLTDKNSDIESIVNALSEKIDTLVTAKEKQDEENAYEITEEGDGAAPSFDFMEALDFLKTDIDDIKNSVAEVIALEQEEKEPAINVNDITDSVNAKLESILEPMKENWLKEIKSYLNSRNLESVIQSINNKLDYMAMGNNEAELIENMNKTIETKVASKIKTLNAKLDVIASGDDMDMLADLTGAIEDVDTKLTNLHSKIDNLPKIAASSASAPASTTPAPVFKPDETKINKINEVLENVDYKLSESDEKITSMLETLSSKIDDIPRDNGTIQDIEYSVAEIKDLITEQKTIIDNLEPTEKIEAFRKCLDELTDEVDGLISTSETDNEQINSALKEMKDSIMAAVVTIFDQVSFIEETEDIKDFVEERTDEINQNIENINFRLQKFLSSDELNKNLETINDRLQEMSSNRELNENISSIKEQLKLLATTEEAPDYTYSMQDIETDLAKLRLALNEIQNGKLELQSSELNLITEKLHNITSSVDMLTQDEIKSLKTELSDLKEQTQFLIATSDKSYNVLNSGMEDFGQMLNGGIAQKVDGIAKMLETSANSDNMVRQSLIYMGEWIDSASASINQISAKSEDISKVVATVTNVENIAEEHQAQLERLEKQLAKFETLEERIEEQQNRIDRLEMSIDKVLSAVENLDDPGLTSKIDKIEKQILKLNNNIEKLTSYVE